MAHFKYSGVFEVEATVGGDSSPPIVEGVSTGGSLGEREFSLLENFVEETVEVGSS